MQFRSSRWLVRAGLAVALAGGLTACGDDDSSSGMHQGTMPMHSDHAVPTTDASPTEVDEAFIRQMIPHHAMAIAMAKSAKSRAQRPEIRELADSIIASQSKEIDQLRAIAKANGYDVGRAASMMGGDARTMGVQRGAMGMSMMTDDLDRSDQFDRAFLAMMIPHHEGAIAMANAQLANGADPQLEAMSKAIIEAQQGEIDEMRTWQKVWFGDKAEDDADATSTTGHMMDGDDMPMH